MNIKLWTSKQATKFLGLSIIPTMLSAIFLGIFLTFTNNYTVTLLVIALIPTIMLWKEFTQYLHVEGLVNYALNTMKTKVSENQEVELEQGSDKSLISLKYAGKKYQVDSTGQGYSLKARHFGKNVHVYTLWPSHTEPKIYYYVINSIYDGENHVTVFVSKIVKEEE